MVQCGTNLNVGDLRTMTVPFRRRSTTGSYVPAKALSTVLLLLCFFRIPLVRDAHAGCIGPGIRLSNDSGAPGASIVVTGKVFLHTCNDVGRDGRRPPPNEPARGVKIFFIQGDVKEQIGIFDADANFEISAKVTIPATAKAGAATIVAQVPTLAKLLSTLPVAFTVVVN